MSSDNDTDRASVQVVEENEATGKVKDVYKEIQKTLGIDFVPNKGAPKEGPCRMGHPFGQSRALFR
jgi:hypothetical protein